MTLRWKLFGALLAMAGLGVASHEIVYHLRPKPASMQERGLVWLRDEYGIPEDRFREIEALHQEYFKKCDLMCAEMGSSARPRILRASLRYQAAEKKTVPSVAAEAPPELGEKKRQKALCERCLSTMVQHLQDVARLMPAPEGKRFLQEILPELTLRESSKSLKSRSPLLNDCPSGRRGQ